MSEAEITEQMVMMMNLTLTGISIFFSIVSAYIVALFYFLRRAPFGYKLTAFGFFTFTLLFLSAFAANSFNHAAALQDALVALGRHSELSPVGAAAVAAGPLSRLFFDIAIRNLTWAGMAMVYMTLAYFTFFHPWARDSAAGAPVDSARGVE